MTIAQNNRILILGGDERLAELVMLLKEKGYMVSTYGQERLQEKDIKEYEALEEAIENNDIIIGPIPFNFGDRINMKLSDKSVFTETFISLLKPEKTLFLGSPDLNFIDLAQKMNIEYFDYNKDECFQISNAAITAEGTIAIMINERKRTIYSSNILVLGYGRLGKMLSEYLKVFNPNLYVAARKNTDITWINQKGHKGIKINEIDRVIGSIDIIVNTVPAHIISNYLIDKMAKDVLIIDLASKPGGLDHSYAMRKKIKTIHSLGLPGKVAPKTAAKTIFETIFILH